MLNAQDEEKRYNQALEDGAIDQATYDELMEEINLGDVYEVIALNDEGKVDISIQSEDIEDEERETGDNLELDGEIRDGSIVEVTAREKGFGGWEEERKRLKQMGQ